MRIRIFCALIPLLLVAPVAQDRPATPLDQGRVVNFGKLLFEGIEPRAGVAQAMLAAWKELQGKRDNSQLLRE